MTGESAFFLNTSTDLVSMEKVVKEEGPDKISVRAAGHLGGIRTAALHGRAHFINAGKRGQRVFCQLYTREDRSRWGKLGGRPKKSVRTLSGER